MSKYESSPMPPRPQDDPVDDERDPKDDDAPDTPPTEPPPVPIKEPPDTRDPKGPFVVR